MKMIVAYWLSLSNKIDGMSLRERALIFAAAAFLVVSLVNTLFLDPLLAEQKKMSQRVIQQEEKMKEIQAQINALVQAKQDDESSPLRQRISHLKRQIAEGDAYLKDRRDKLVPQEKMAALLEQVLNRNGHLQLIALQTLPVTPLIEANNAKQGEATVIAKTAGQEQQVFKHGVQITVRGSYADLTQYLSSLEHLPARMFWGMAKMNVVQYPVVELTLTLYTLSLDKTWMQV